jgi:hypothetical protein
MAASVASRGDTRADANRHETNNIIFIVFFRDAASLPVHDNRIGTVKLIVAL